MPLAIVIVLAIAWFWLWYYAASIADRTMAGWIEREAAAGRVYSCGTQSIGGFPFGLTVRCTNPAAQIKNGAPPYDVKAGDVSFSAEIYRPTRLVGDIVGPLPLARWPWSRNTSAAASEVDWSKLATRGSPRSETHSSSCSAIRTSIRASDSNGPAFARSGANGPSLTTCSCCAWWTVRGWRECPAWPDTARSSRRPCDRWDLD
jgi:hypothetical protein